MKPRYLALALTAAVLLPTFAYADDDTDAISASFDRDLTREIEVRYLPATATDADPLDVINVALRASPDPVLASFERDLDREPVAFKALPARDDSDPLDVINAALRCNNTGTISASIQHELNRC
ncbi:MAG: hypothetical protein ABI479_09525 [Gallionella sp.]